MTTATIPSAASFKGAKSLPRRIFNFSAGPAVLPEEVLLQCQQDIWSIFDSGIGIMEHSHRGPVFDRVIDEAKADCRKIASISDDYEVANGFDTNNAADALLDLDLDGSNNRAEFVAGTDPNNNQSYLKVELDALPGAAAVEVSAVANRSYTVQYTDAFGTGQWLKLGDVFARATNRVEVFPDPTWTSNRFYRVVVPLQP